MIDTTSSLLATLRLKEAELLWQQMLTLLQIFRSHLRESCLNLVSQKGCGNGLLTMTMNYEKSGAYCIGFFTSHHPFIVKNNSSHNATRSAATVARHGRWGSICSWNLRDAAILIAILVFSKLRNWESEALIQQASWSRSHPGRSAQPVAFPLWGQHLGPDTVPEKDP